MTKPDRAMARHNTGGRTAMKKKSTEMGAQSSVTWETLEGCIRVKMRDWLQDLLEAEVDEWLGRRKSQRRKGVDATPGYRNGYGKPRRLTLCNGTVIVRRPRVRGLEQRLDSRLRPLFARGPQPSMRGCPSSICTGWLWATSSWPCAACWERTRPSRRRR